MFSHGKTWLGLAVALTAAWPVSGQQRQNDFTKKIRAIDGKITGLSSRRLSSANLNPRFSRRIHVNQIPFKYSRFGGKRFPVGNLNVRASKTFPVSTFPVKRFSAGISSFDDRRADLLAGNLPATASVDFRDHYYEKLDQRVDDWMSKVNNMSLQDVNRYQFRRGRSAEPGFPVQQAGSRDLPKMSRDRPLGQGLPSGFRGVTQPGSASPSSPPSSYHLGPMRALTSGGSRESASPSALPPPKSSPTFLGQPRKSTGDLRPRLGPKRISVSVK